MGCLRARKRAGIDARGPGPSAGRAFGLGLRFAPGAPAAFRRGAAPFSLARIPCRPCCIDQQGRRGGRLGAAGRCTGRRAQPAWRHGFIELRARLAGDPPDITIVPKTGPIGLFEFHRAREAIEIGIKAAEKQIDEIKIAVRSLAC